MMFKGCHKFLKVSNFSPESTNSMFPITLQCGILLYVSFHVFRIQVLFAVNTKLLSLVLFAVVFHHWFKSLVVDHVTFSTRRIGN